jgi:hypothetical protein
MHSMVFISLKKSLFVGSFYDKLVGVKIPACYSSISPAKEKCQAAKCRHELLLEGGLGVGAIDLRSD